MRKRIWRAISSAASKLVPSAVSSKPPAAEWPLVLTSIAHKRGGFVQDDGATGRKIDRRRQRLVDLFFHAVGAEQRHVLGVKLQPFRELGREQPAERPRILELGRVVEHHARDPGPRRIAQCADHGIRLLVNPGRRRRLGSRADHPFPAIAQIFDVAHEGVAPHAGGGGPEDVALALFGQLGDRFGEPVTLSARLDSARDPHAGMSGGQNESAPRQRGPHGQARALSRHRFLEHLNHHRVPLP